MRSLLALVAAGVALTVTAPAQAQAPTVLSARSDPGQTINQLLSSGFGYTVTTNAPITFTAQLTTKIKGRTLVLTKSIRTEQNAGQTGEPGQLLARLRPGEGGQGAARPQARPGDVDGGRQRRRRLPPGPDVDIDAA
jgi:hypothetical protein